MRYLTKRVFRLPLSPITRVSHYATMTNLDSFSTLLERDSATIPLVPKADAVKYPDLTPKIASTENKYLRAALHLLNDDIHSCHLIAQSDESDPKLNLLHYVLHRREGDFGNSCWWVGRQESDLLTELYGGSNLIEAKTNAKAFVGRVERWSKGGKRDTNEERELQKFQQKELSTIVKHYAD